MASTLIVPGVQVRTEFEPAPVLPGATGILGLVGIANSGPLLPTPVGNFGEFTDIFGAASRYSMPEARAAFANGVMEIVVARIEPGRGQKATTTLIDDDGEQVAVLEARAEGAWGSQLAVRVTQAKTLGGTGVKYVNLDLLLGGEVTETLANLVMDETSPNYLFDRINSQSRLIVAYDPLFEKGLPLALAKTPFTQLDARAAAATLKAGATDVIALTAKAPGDAGNLSAVRVADGHAGLALQATGNAPAIDVAARTPGAAGQAIRVGVTAGSGSSINVVVTPSGGAPRTLGPFTTADAIVTALAADPDVIATKQADALPAVAAPTPLSRRVTIDVVTEGRETATYADLPNNAAIAAISDPLVGFAVVGAATALPDATAGVPMVGGRPAGPALMLAGDASSAPLLEIQPVSGAIGALALKVDRAISTIDNATGVVNLSVFVDDALTETFANLTMDPDDRNYLPAVLQGSGLIRGHDLFQRSRSTSMPRPVARPQAFTGGTSPLVDDYQSALDRLEQAEEVDLVMASVDNQLVGADVRAVHQAVAAHCAKMADVARNRIGLGSVTIDETNSVAAILDHADDVRSDNFVLVTPAGGAAAVAGLLSLQDYFQSPTFKNVPSLGVPAGAYTDAQLNQLVGGNVLVVEEKRKLGIIVVKGVLTSGRQINVQRIANKAVRDVKAIADVYIGLLNNDGTRNALLQQVTAMFLQMERDGAIVPSTDGKDPAFKVDVYSTQADFDNGIVRIDVAMRPVRAIDYIYATILVQN
jgi:hypothetical protein